MAASFFARTCNTTTHPNERHCTASETFFLESFKGQRHLPRIARKRGGKAAKRGLSTEQIPVLVVRDRHGETADFVLQGVGVEQIESVLKPLLNKYFRSSKDDDA